VTVVPEAILNAPLIKTVGVLLAAGVGHRFDAAHPGRKLEVLIDGVSVAERSLATLAASTDAVVVVARTMTTPIAQWARQRSHGGVCPEITESIEAGMGLSLACGAAYVMQRFAAATTVVIALADMPWVRPLTVTALVAASQAEDVIVQPLHGGGKGHPVVFPARYLSELAACRADVGAKHILQAHALNLHLLEVEDVGVIRDVDVPQDVSVGR
jgi:molybdenum cofactor cytidylyltransferase